MEKFNSATQNYLLENAKDPSLAEKYYNQIVEKINMLESQLKKGKGIEIYSDLKIEDWIILNKGKTGIEYSVNNKYMDYQDGEAIRDKVKTILKSIPTAATYFKEI